MGRPQALFSDTSLYPEPVNDGLRFNQFNTGSTTLMNNQGDAKVDWKPTEADLVSTRYSQGVQDRPSQNTFPLRFDSFNNSPFQAGVVNWTRTLTPTAVNEVRIGANHVTLHNRGADKGLGNVAEKLGIRNGNDRGPGLMDLQFSGGLASNIGSRASGPARCSRTPRTST